MRKERTLWRVRSYAFSRMHRTLEGVKKFYRELFGWKPDMNSTIIDVGTESASMKRIPRD